MSESPLSPHAVPTSAHAQTKAVALLLLAGCLLLPGRFTAHRLPRILAGLAEGAVVVVPATPDLRDGQAVTLK